MAYYHEIEQGEFLGMRHYRSTASATGLIELEQIALSQAVLAPDQEHKLTESVLVKATPSDIEHVSRTRVENSSNPDLPNQIICEDLDEFVSTALHRWRELVESNPRIVHINLVMGELRSVDTGRFVGYVPSSNEITALDRIANALSQLTTLPATGTAGDGNYL